MTSPDPLQGESDLSGRRHFLSAAAATVLGALVLPSCTGTSGPTASSPGASLAPSGPGAAAGAPGDVALGRTMASLEALAIAVYDSALNAGQISTPALADVAKLFIDHHRQHLNALEGTVGAPRDSTQPNAAVRQATVDPVFSDPALDESKMLALVFGLEDVAAQTYVFATTQLTRPDLRSTLMTIGSVEARHRSILGMVALKRSAPDLIGSGFFRSDNPLPAAALLG